MGKNTIKRNNDASKVNARRVASTPPRTVSTPTGASSLNNQSKVGPYSAPLSPSLPQSNPKSIVLSDPTINTACISTLQNFPALINNTDVFIANSNVTNKLTNVIRPTAGVTSIIPGVGISVNQPTGDVTVTANGAYSMYVPNVLYVAKNGLDTNDGLSLSTAFLTIKAALAVATSGTVVYVKSGTYAELNPVTVPEFVAVVGDDLRTVSVVPLDLTEDTFYVNKGCYLTGMTFRGHVNSRAAVAFNPDGSAGAITTSPYIQNCSSITSTGCGVRINGDYVDGLKGMVMDAYTQFNQGGLGVHILNGGYAQLVSIFTICTEYGILCESGGQCSVTNSNCSFGDYALKAVGVYPSILDSGTSSTVNIDTNSILLTGLSSRPSVNDVVLFDGNATYFTIAESTPLSVGTSTVRFIENINAITSGTNFDIYKRSLISSSGHTFEYVGSGTDLATAIPQNGGQPIPENQIVEAGGGKVFFTSTDEQGNFRVGTGFTIESATGTISGRTFNQSLFSIMTPYILAIT